MGSNTRFSYFLFLISWKLSEASFCGNAAIPYSFEATKTGQPVLGCARPACFGWTAEGKALSSTPAFYRVNKKPDGFLRKDHKEEFHRVVDMDVAENFSPQNARCPTTFEHEQCPRDDQWVGGIAPVTNVSGLPLALQCCTYEKLGLAEDRGVAVVNQGQIVVGGEVMKDGRQYAFDYIADIVKHVKSDGMISYDVSLRRMPCLPTPSEYTLTVDDSVIDKLLDKAGKSIELLKSTSNEVPSARRFKSKHHDETTEVEKISVSSAEHVTPRNSAKAVWDDHPSPMRFLLLVDSKANITMKPQKWKKFLYHLLNMLPQEILPKQSGMITHLCINTTRNLMKKNIINMRSRGKKKTKEGMILHQMKER
uniref:Uncharacterized protein n=1 Tax=Acrobeloides nanus TaxID=290746 RepID=A0A914EDY7_9BILA